MPDNESTARLSLDIDGLKRGLREARQEIQHANAVFKAETAGMDDWTKDADGLSAKLKNLGDVLSKQRYILDNYNDQVKKHRENQERAADEADRLRKELQALSEKGVEPTATEYKKLEKQYQAAIKSERAEAEQVKKLETNIVSQTAEIKKTEAAYKKWETAQEALDKESRSLIKTVDEQERELRDLKQRYVDTAAAEGADSDAAKELAAQIKTLSSNLRDNKTAMAEAQKSADSLDHSMDTAGDSAEDAAGGFSTAGEELGRLGDIIKGSLIARGIEALFTAAVRAVKNGVKSIADAVTDAASYADDILTLSQTTGIAAETLQEFQYMEGLADVETSTVAKSIQKLKKSMSSADAQTKKYNSRMAAAAEITDDEKRAAKEATIELGSTAAGFQQLGIELTDSNGRLRNSEDVFFEMIDALGQIDDETARDALAMELLGKSATDLNPLIEAGSERLFDLRQEAHDVGYVLDGQTLGALGRAQDAMDRLDKRTEGVKNQFAKGLAPGAEKLATTLDQTLGSPKTQRAITLLSEGLGSFLSTLADFAANGIGFLVDAFGIFDSRLALYNDEQLESIAATQELKENMDYLHGSYLDEAEAIEINRARTEDLWKELQTLVTENGNVKKGNEERVDFILHELNAALGTEYERNGDLIEQYKDMKKSIGDLIAEQEVQSLLASGEEEYATALRESGKEATRAAKLYTDLIETEKKLAEQTEKTKAAKQAYINSDEDLESGRPLWRIYQKELGLQDDLEKKLADLQADYATSSEAATRYADVIARTEAAKTAAYRGEFETARKIMTQELDARREAHREADKISKEDIQTLRQQHAEQLKAVEDYRAKYQSGMDGYTKPVLDELTRQETETKKILDRIARGATTWGEALGNNLSAGLVNGMSAYDIKVQAQAEKQVKAALKTMQSVAQIASPSKVTEEFGEFIDLGWIKGMKAKMGLLRATAKQVAQTALQGPAAAQNAASRAPATGSGGTTNNFTQNIYAPKTPSRLELYRDGKNLLEMAGGI